LNLMMKYLKSPLRYFGKIGSIFIFLGLIACFWILYRVYFIANPLEDINILLTSVFLFVVTGFQFFVWGLLADLLVKTGKRKSIYLTELPLNEYLFVNKCH